MNHKKFQVTVNQTYTFDLTENDMKDLNFIELNPSKFHVLKEHKSYHTEIISENFNDKSYRININETPFDITISDELDQLIKDLGFEIGTSKQVNAIKAPMPGLILSINVEIGQEVQENDSLLVLEAMKMENNFNSPRAGIIKSILVNKGDAVDKGQLLIEFE
ncbi:MAG: acetyl-CoA carboxylase biotin carboxyl carrier protein subunit [Moheibacter sp.]